MRPWSRSAAAVIAVALGIALGAPAWAQTSATTADLVVVAIDDSGAVVPNAAISISNQERGLTRTGTTGPQGRYSVPALPPRTYAVRAELAGFEPAADAIDLRLGTATELLLTLHVAGIATQVDVPAAMPLVSMRRTAAYSDVERTRRSRCPPSASSLRPLLRANCSSASAWRSDTHRHSSQPILDERPAAVRRQRYDVDFRRSSTSRVN